MREDAVKILKLAAYARVCAEQRGILPFEGGAEGAASESDTVNPGKTDAAQTRAENAWRE
jgi:hypothetical protein